MIPINSINGIIRRILILCKKKMLKDSHLQTDTSVKYLFGWKITYIIVTISGYICTWSIDDILRFEMSHVIPNRLSFATCIPATFNLVRTWAYTPFEISRKTSLILSICIWTKRKFKLAVKMNELLSMKW